LWNEIVRIHSPSNFEHHCEFGTKIANILEGESGVQVGLLNGNGSDRKILTPLFQEESFSVIEKDLSHWSEKGLQF
jgi:hypothetical protein